jgi:hypothetical protein
MSLMVSFVGETGAPKLLCCWEFDWSELETATALALVLALELCLPCERGRSRSGSSTYEFAREPRDRRLRNMVRRRQRRVEALPLYGSKSGSDGVGPRQGGWWRFSEGWMGWMGGCDEKG